MKPPFLRCVVVSLLVTFLGISVSLCQADERIALAGQGYGRTEAQSIINVVFHRDLQSVPYEDVGEFLSADDYRNFGMVVLAGMDAERAYTIEESEKIRDYVEGGGRLVLIRQAPKLFPDGTKGGFLFGPSFYVREGAECEVRQPDASLLAGAIEGEHPFWLKGNVFLKSLDWENLIGTDTYILVGERRLGQGKLYYLGSELFRLLNESKSGQQGGVEGWVQILKNIFNDTAK